MSKKIEVLRDFYLHVPEAIVRASGTGAGLRSYSDPVLENLCLMIAYTTPGCADEEQDPEAAAEIRAHLQAAARLFWTAEMGLPLASPLPREELDDITTRFCSLATHELASRHGGMTLEGEGWIDPARNSQVAQMRMG